MSVYHFSAAPATTESATFETWVGGFTDEELDNLIGYCEQNLEINEAILGDDRSDNDIRKSSTAWVKLTPETEWLYAKLANIARNVNALHWKFDLTGFAEDFQFTIYEGENSHYTWHNDQAFSKGIAARKLSMVVQLSDPDDYEEGDLELWDGVEPKKIPRQRGLVTVFPSYLLHRVTPLKKGTRKSLVIWVSGPPFK